MAKSRLTPKQEAFVREYLQCLNATEAAKRAGYSEKTAEQLGYQLLQKTSVSDAIAQQQKKLQDTFEITQERIIKELAAVAFGNVGMVANWNEEEMSAIPKDQMDENAIKYLDSIEKITLGEDITQVKVKTLANQKVKALELLGKHVGLWGKQNGNDGTGTDKRDQKAIIGRLSEIYRKRKSG
jgi:phage terminase small subunit